MQVRRSQISLDSLKWHHMLAAVEHMIPITQCWWAYAEFGPAFVCAMECQPT